MTLVEFLLAQIAEDENIARIAQDGPWDTFSTDQEIRSAQPQRGEIAWVNLEEDRLHIARHDPVRVRAEGAAKRRIMEIAFDTAATIDGEWGCCHDADEIRAGECLQTNPDNDPVLRALASVYAAHPDYNPAWSQ